MFELRRANEILKAASVFFAALKGSLGRHSKAEYPASTGVECPGSILGVVQHFDLPLAALARNVEAPRIEITCCSSQFDPKRRSIRSDCLDTKAVCDSPWNTMKPAWSTRIRKRLICAQG